VKVVAAAVNVQGTLMHLVKNCSNLPKGEKKGWGRIDECKAFRLIGVKKNSLGLRRKESTSYREMGGKEKWYSAECSRCGGWKERV